MSVKVMSAVFEGELPPMKRLVMLALADHANDEGVCYPSISRLCKRTGLSERAVQKHVAELEADGHLSRAMNGGKKGSNLYRLTPAPCAPPHDVHPAPCAPLPPHDVHPPPARRAPEPSVTINEPSVEDNAGAKPVSSQPKDRPPQKARLPADWVPDDECWDYARSLKLNDDEIKEIADDFHVYWTDRTDAGGKKSERGWKQAWRNRCRDQAPRFIRNRQMAFGQGPGGRGQGGSVASIVARRHAGG